MGCTVQFAPLIAGMSSSSPSSGGFRTPKSAVWNKGVTAQAPASGQDTRNKNNQNHARGEIIDFFLEITETFGCFLLVL
jgi:hypothetical protein